jgi:hypothetical protein
MIEPAGHLGATVTERSDCDLPAGRATDDATASPRSVPGPGAARMPAQTELKGDDS